MARLEWEKASRRERFKRSNSPRPKTTAARRQQAIADFAHKYQLSCFVCKAQEAEWAKSGVSARGRWVICVACVKRQAARLHGPISEA